MRNVEDELRAFDEGRVAPADFPHAEHLRFAFEILARCPFGEAAERFRRGLGHIVQQAGKPELYHATITVAFLALIAERRATSAALDWPTFIAANQDLLNKDVLLRWYSQEQLQSRLARATFCLPHSRGAGD